MMGMPTRKEEEKIRKKREDRHTRTTSYYREDEGLSRGEKIVRDMQEYAEDVDFIEIKEDDPKGK